MPDRVTDAYGNPLATTPAVRDAYDRGVALFLGGNAGALDAFDAALAADPGFALGHAARARALFMGGDGAGARAAIAEARRLVGDDPREAGHVAAVAHLVEGRPQEARRAVEAHVRAFPRDPMVAQMCTNIFGLIGFSGCTGREADLLAYTSALLPHYGDDWWMMSMQALSLCETGHLAAALDLMEQALELNPRNAHAAHFKAHTLYELGETGTGRRFLTGWLDTYDPGAALNCHLAWHAALWALADGDTEEMWARYDASIDPETSAGLPINVVTDGAALLFRAELAGITVDPAQWRKLSDFAATTFARPGQSFVDMHAALAHAMAGDGERLARIAETRSGFAADLVRPVARAWGLIARGDWAGALDALTPVMAGTDRLGGSRAQRDLLELTWANVLMRLGKSDEAGRALATRRPVLSPQLAGMEAA